LALSKAVAGDFSLIFTLVQPLTKILVKSENFMNNSTVPRLSKVPELTLLFWIIKIAATTLGETAGDAVSMSMNLGYLVGTAIFSAIFIIAATAQIRAKSFHPLLYWTTVIATTTVGTTLADFADRSLGIGYAGGASLLFVLLLGSLALWYKSLGSVSVNTISTPKAEMFYWLTIMFSQNYQGSCRVLVLAVFLLPVASCQMRL